MKKRQKSSQVLNEGAVRRFMGLANIGQYADSFLKEEFADEHGMPEEEEEEVPPMDAAAPPVEAPVDEFGGDPAEEEFEDAEASVVDLDPDQAEALAAELATAVMDVLGVDGEVETSADLGDDEELGDDMDVDMEPAPEEEMGAAPPAPAAPEEEMDDDMLQETAFIKKVISRVAKRLREEETKKTKRAMIIKNLVKEALAKRQQKK